MTSTGPRIRASHTQATLRALGRRSPSGVDGVLARLDPEIAAGLDDAIKGDFLPAAWDQALVTAIRGVLGAPVARVVLRDMMRSNLSGPLLGGLLSTAQALFGRSPGGLLRWAGRAYAHVTRECGEVTLEAAEEGTATLRMTGMPEGLATAAYLDGIAGAIEAIFDICRVDGSVALRDATADGARFVVEWQATRRGLPD